VLFIARGGISTRVVSESITIARAANPYEHRLAAPRIIKPERHRRSGVRAAANLTRKITGASRRRLAGDQGVLMSLPSMVKVCTSCEQPGP
jgi:hypothetical protein